MAPAFAFAFQRLLQQAGEDDRRPFVFAASRHWLRERGRPCAQGLARRAGGRARLILIAPAKEAEALWALEEALKSGAVAGGMAGVEQVPFVMTRRLDFAARAGKATAVLLRPSPPDDLSAAHLRWRVTSLASTAHPLDAKSPGVSRLEADLVRRRDGAPGTYLMEAEDETHRLGLAAGLAGDGLVTDGRTVAAA
jgi:protein ImuA